MRWPLILLLSLHGVVVGGAVVLGLLPESPRWLEFALWMAMAVVVVPILGFKIRRLPMANGFVCGLLAGLLSHAIVIAFFTTFLDNNPEAAAQLTSDQVGLDVRLYRAIIAPPISMTWGLVIAVGTLVVFKLRKPPPTGGSGLP